MFAAISLLLPLISCTLPQFAMQRLPGVVNQAMAPLHDDIVIAGYTDIVLPQERFFGNTDAVLFRYSSSEVWLHTFGSEGYDEFQAVCVDQRTSDIYAVGYLNGTSVFDGKLFVAKYTSNGTLLWSKTWGSESGDALNDCVVHEDVLYIAGFVGGPFHSLPFIGVNDLYYAAIAANGTTLWERVWGTAGNDKLNALVVYQDQVYAYGFVNGNIDGKERIGQLDLYLAQVRETGVSWSMLWGSTRSESPGSIAVFEDHFYCAFQTSGVFGGGVSSGQYDAGVSKINLNGVVWTTTFGSAGNDAVNGIAVFDKSVFLSGYVFGSVMNNTYSGNGDGFIAELSQSDGTLLELRSIGTSAFDSFYEMIYNSKGKLYALYYRGEQFESYLNVLNFAATRQPASTTRTSIQTSRLVVNNVPQSTSVVRVSDSAVQLTDAQKGIYVLPVYLVVLTFFIALGWLISQKVSDYIHKDDPTEESSMDDDSIRGKRKSQDEKRRKDDKRKSKR